MPCYTCPSCGQSFQVADGAADPHAGSPGGSRLSGPTQAAPCPAVANNPGAGDDFSEALAAEADPNAQVDEFLNTILLMGMTPEEVETQVLQRLIEEDARQQTVAGPNGGLPAVAGPDTTGFDRIKNRHTLLKVASMARYRFRAGQWRLRPVRPNTQEAQERLETQQWICELCYQK